MGLLQDALLHASGRAMVVNDVNVWLAEFQNEEREAEKRSDAPEVDCTVSFFTRSSALVRPFIIEKGCETASKKSSSQFQKARVLQSK